MGAKFVPSMANLFMAKWEEHVIYRQPRPELVFWKRYTDDILLWDGSVESLNIFRDTLNNNDRGISLQHEYSKTEIHFLDLRIIVCEGGIITTTYFKETDRSRFIDTSSWYHSAWLESIPKSQFLRLKRNCTNCTNFLQEAESLNQRFLEKGYDPVELDRTLKIADERNREDLLVPRQTRQTDAFTSGFFDQLFYSTLHS